uniref:Uncharacterized protein n=1 Tax=Kwoniella bestiolae CBS 10118 TaxID=1296100 RepID=A0A1B9FWU8_9TREE|nr:hypothetical protein I302_07596 [Kwoniella bestiolae CBS 10118]OCF23242.1 hypothetical protein I302_07596 [Kwoniella bestiolae CBS 10118]
MPRHILQPLPKAFKPSSSSRHLRHDENMWESLDRVQVLGERDGHMGCVNALSWSDDGKTLLSGSDDKRICIWQPDPHPTSSSSSRSPHPLKIADTISTGHRANIFSAKFLPNTSTPTIVSCAGDRDVRVFEVERLVRDSATGELKGERGDGVTILKCHKDRTKRIATENSPYLFLTVSEDGTVRQHDLRRPHTCRSQCPEPLFYAPKGVDLYSLSVSTVTPHVFAVAGRTDCAFICDRRMLPRQTPSWGPNIRSSGQVHCVRKLGLSNDEWEKVAPNGGSRLFGEERHITCVKMSPQNADEVAVSFAKHSTSLFSIYDSPPSNSMRSGSPAIVPPSNSNQRKRGSNSPSPAKGKGESKSPSPAPRSPPSPIPDPPVPYIAADDVPLRSTQVPKIVAEEDEEEEATERDSSPSRKRRQSDRESVLEDSGGPSSRARITGEDEQQDNTTRVATWPFIRGDPSGSGTQRSILNESDEAESSGHGGSEGVININDTSRAEQGQSSSQARVGPPTPPQRYTAADFLRAENEDEEEGMEERFDPGGMLDVVTDEEDEDDDDDALDEFDEDDEDEMEVDDEEEEEVDQDFMDGDVDMDPDIDILGFGGSNASRLESKAFDAVDVVHPRRSFRGARNVETVKDCNFLGTRADKVCSGSDDGNFFVWDKETGRLEGIWEGDGSVVNVMEQHPTLPLVAVSGIDNTVKMFAPTHQPITPSFSRMHLAQNIIERNTRLPRFLPGGSFERATLLQFLASRGIRVRSEVAAASHLNGEGGGEGDEDDESVEGCATQ